METALWGIVTDIEKILKVKLGEIGKICMYKGGNYNQGMYVFQCNMGYRGTIVQCISFDEIPAPSLERNMCLVNYFPRNYM
jgi:hypothetical protein